MLTERAIRNNTKPGLYGDRGNLYLKITPTGTKSWVFRYSVPAPDKGADQRRRHALGLGSYPDVPLAEARERAYEERRRRLAGNDPAAIRRAAAAAKRVAEAKAMTFQDCAEAYIKAHRAGWKTIKEANEWTASMRIYVEPVLGELPVAAVDLPLVLRVIEPMWQTRTSTASRVRQRIENILDWATVRGYRTGDNPARWKGHLDKMLPKVSKVAPVEHYAAMPYADVAAFMIDLHTAGRTSSQATAAKGLQFAILTATRVGEVIGATWQEIDFKGRVWVIPAERMKAGREHRVPLSDAALALLQALPRTGDRVFPVGDVALWRVAKRIRPEITVHGFRSTFRDWAGERTSYAREVVEQCLAHAAGDQTELAYRRGDALEKRRHVMDAWAKFCAQPAPAGGNVVGLQEAG